MMGDPHLRRVPAGILDGPVSGDVSLEQAVVRPHRGERAVAGRWPHAEEVGLRREDVGLVDGDPARAKVAERFHRDARELREAVRKAIGEDTPALGQPDGQRKW